MRTRTVAALTLSLLYPAWALAQDEGAQQEEQQQQDQSETEGAEVSETPAQPGQVAVPKGGRETAPGEVHTVVKGDTLWDLSQRFLGNPWYWPKVWSYNPEIANPHFIYPGNQVRFFAGGEEVPTQVEVGQGPTPIEGGGEQAPEVSAGEMIPSDELTSSDVQVVGKIGFTPKPSQRVMHEGIVTPRELDEAGVIDGSFAETVMLSYPDTAYVKFKNPGSAKVGDRYVIFKTESEVRHPVTGAKVGYLTKFLGTMVVTRTDSKLVSAQITDTWDEITRGNFVGPFGERLTENVSAQPNARAVKGYIVTAMNPVADDDRRVPLRVHRQGQRGRRPGGQHLHRDPPERLPRPHPDRPVEGPEQGPAGRGHRAVHGGRREAEDDHLPDDPLAS